MPGIVRKLLLFATIDGLVLQPAAQRNQRPAVSVVIDYEKHDINPSLKDQRAVHRSNTDEAIEVFGIIGLLKVASAAYLISVSRKRQIAQIWGKPIFVISDVAVIPLSSHVDAQKAIRRLNEERRVAEDRAKEVEDGLTDAFSEADEDDHSTTEDNWSIGEDSTPAAFHNKSVEIPQSPAREERKPGIAEEVFSSRGVYGRFADRWFSRRGWTTNRLGGPTGDGEAAKRDARLEDGNKNNGTSGMGVVSDDDFERWPQTPGLEKSSEDAMAGNLNESLASSLTPKLVRTTRLLLNSNTFFYSYDLDITRRLPARQPSSEVPLHRQVDTEYFWNKHLSTSFVDAGLDEYVLPIMQGFVGQRMFSLETSSGDTQPISSVGKSDNSQLVPDSPYTPTTPKPSEKENRQDFLITLISRRSIKRAGLRYLRRGIDEEGNVANAVETEQILSSPSWDTKRKMYSFVQTRGSIPLFYSQMPYTFKPPPKLHASARTNETALKKHFSNLKAKYGDVQAVSLIDHHGGEQEIGEVYENTVNAINRNTPDGKKLIDFTWFDFHQVCKGMKFENVSELVQELEPFLEASRFNTIQASQQVSMQKGIIRTNCMDCLDRTNVAQSALGQYALSRQLQDSGFSIDLASDPTTIWFNTIWADNGDAISRAYTGTSALKGDYTRTRKRNALGALTDLSLTLTRYYHNLFDDFFTQAAIDYLLGSVNEGVFAEFESTMTTVDPAMDVRKARQMAIDSAVHVVIEEDEDLLHGWALLVPAVPNTLRTFPFAESLLLLTEKAIYVVDFDWDASKVRSFERIDLLRVVGLQYGSYITETHTQSQMDPVKNVGLLIQYLPPPHTSDEGLSTSSIRVNTRTVENSIRDAWSITGADGHEEVLEGEIDADSASESERRTEKDIDGTIGNGNRDKKDDKKQPKVEEQDKNSKNPVQNFTDLIDIQRHNPRFLSFKALPEREASMKPNGKGMAKGKVSLEMDIVRQVCEEISSCRAKMSVTNQDSGRARPESDKKDEDLKIERKDVLSLSEARKSTGYVESLAWSLKKAIWGGV